MQAFCADFGPFNLGMMHFFCETLAKLLSQTRSDSIVFYTSTAPYDVTNAIFLLGAFLVTRLGATPEQAWAPFRGMSTMLRPYRDATWCQSTYDLTLLHCYQGLKKAMDVGLYLPNEFDMDEYFYYDFPENGDMHEVVKDKFIAFKGPSDDKQTFWTKRPSDYFEVFRGMGVSAVVRLNQKEYDEKEVVEAEFAHHDIFFADCSTPSDAIADRFLRVAEETAGALAVHCLAGLGRTGTLIALYIMKHLHFTANEAIAWLRIVRPGSVIGPQQQYLRSQEERMWALGRAGARGLGLDDERSIVKTGMAAPTDGDPEIAAELAKQVTAGVQLRDRLRGTAQAKECSGGRATTSTGKHERTFNQETDRCTSPPDLEAVGAVPRPTVSAHLLLPLTLPPVDKRGLGRASRPGLGLARATLPLETTQEMPVSTRRRFAFGSSERRSPGTMSSNTKASSPPALSKKLPPRHRGWALPFPGANQSSMNRSSVHRCLPDICSGSAEFPQKSRHAVPVCI